MSTGTSSGASDITDSITLVTVTSDFGIIDALEGLAVFRVAERGHGCDFAAVEAVGEGVVDYHCTLGVAAKDELRGLVSVLRYEEEEEGRGGGRRRCTLVSGH